MKTERDFPVRQGGLYRCCIETLKHYTGEPKEGDVLGCAFCNALMVWRDGAWEWKRDAED